MRQARFRPRGGLSLQNFEVMAKWIVAAIFGMTCLSCEHPRDPSTLVLLIEQGPVILDPRIGTDGQSERIDELLFDSLVQKDDHFNVQPGVAESWEMPDPRTYIFHLRKGIQFHDGRALTARDVKLNSLPQVENVSSW